MQSFCFFCYPNRLTWMLICSQLPKIHFCKELSPVPAKGAVPIPAPLGWGWSQATLACCTQRVSVGYKPLATAAFPSFKVQSCSLGKKRDSNLPLSWEVTTGEGTWECLERKKPLGALELDCCDVLWSLARACRGQQWHCECGSSVWVIQPSWAQS